MSPSSSGPSSWRAPPERVPPSSRVAIGPEHEGLRLGQGWRALGRNTDAAGHEVRTALAGQARLPRPGRIADLRDREEMGGAAVSVAGLVGLVRHSLLGFGGVRHSPSGRAVPASTGANSVRNDDSAWPGFSLGRPPKKYQPLLPDV